MNMLIAILLFQILLQAEALQCYICNTQHPNTTDVRPDPCIELQPQAYENYGECLPNSLCSKTVFQHHGGFTIQRSCASRTSRDGFAHRVGCGNLRYPESEKADRVSLYDKICFCDTDYCNGREALMPGIVTFTITLTCALLVR
ncbi:unnamed protein product [Allacma fusca]|uniref:Protein sleepless n=1 Tax=Allacma fusca TaxID=39272 RepID=A0A8J2P850_9HEXA|nr:unnamed protein product [Allacma fusca]